MNKTMNAYDALVAIKAAVEANHNRLRAEPDFSGDAYDQWQDEEDALTNLEDSLSKTIAVFEESMEARRSLKRMVIKL